MKPAMREPLSACCQRLCKMRCEHSGWTRRSPVRDPLVVVSDNPRTDFFARLWLGRCSLVLLFARFLRVLLCAVCTNSGRRIAEQRGLRDEADSGRGELSGRRHWRMTRSWSFPAQLSLLPASKSQKSPQLFNLFGGNLDA